MSKERQSQKGIMVLLLQMIYWFIVFGIVIGLTVWTLMQAAYGYLPLDPDLAGNDWFQESGFVLEYCRDHASDSLNPSTGLVDKVIITRGWFDGETCVTVKQAHDAFLRNEIKNQTLGSILIEDEK